MVGLAAAAPMFAFTSAKIHTASRLATMRESDTPSRSSSCSIGVSGRVPPGGDSNRNILVAPTAAGKQLEPSASSPGCGSGLGLGGTPGQTRSCRLHRGGRRPSADEVEGPRADSWREVAGGLIWPRQRGERLACRRRGPRIQPALSGFGTSPPARLRRRRPPSGCSSPLTRNRPD